MERLFNKSQEKSLYPLPKDGRVSFVPNISMPTSYWLAIGYIFINNFAVRVDVFERVFFIVRQKLKSGPFLESSDLMNPIGCNSQQLTNILSFCGCQNITLGNEKKIFFYEQKVQKKIKNLGKKNKKKITKKITKKINMKNLRRKEKEVDPNSPFAVLQKLL